MIKILEESGVDTMVDIIGTVWEEEEMPEDWKQSEIVRIYKQKGDPLGCGNYRGIKLLEHGMKILEKIIEGRLRKTVEIDPMQVWLYAREGNHRRHLHLPANTRKTSRKKSRIVHNFC